MKNGVDNGSSDQNGVSKVRGINRMTPQPNLASCRRLTDKQLTFSIWYCSAEVNMNGTEAARRAGYKGSDGTLRVIAAENLTKPNIRNEIDRRLNEALSGADITIERVLRNLEITRIKALADSHYSAAVRCLELQGKYLKMFTDKIEHVQTIEEVSNEELIQLLQGIAKSGGLDLDQLLLQARLEPDCSEH